MVMLHSFLISALATLAVATPMTELDTRSLVARQSSADDLDQGCKDTILIFARGSTELGNMGTVIGPPLCSALKKNLGEDKVACQGVGDMYHGGLVENALPQNTDPGSISTAKSLFEKASTKCPQSKIVAGGYSQGSAVIDNAVQELTGQSRNMVKGVVFFGFTRNLQDHGQIPGYPKENVKVYCEVGDMVCNGTLVVTPAHMTYGAKADDAASFLVSKVQGQA
ncbi:putative cutinase 1 [Aspergillus coremiiformis]|uniref:Cutinase n=1 Tax=Aspergillus coremiiformis TaxID=138285 RepID=A0A5N6Z7D8_9EURO|nr:putative cutinase 1 [Aspergillus coremiiformis]